MFSSLKVVALSPPTFQGSLEEMESWEQGGDQGKGGSVKMGRLGRVPSPSPILPSPAATAPPEAPGAIRLWETKAGG